MENNQPRKIKNKGQACLTKPRARSNGGQAMIIAVLFFLSASFAIVVGVNAIVLEDLKIGNTLLTSKESYFLSEAGVEDVTYRVKNGITVTSPEILTLGGFSAETTISDLFPGKVIVAEGDKRDSIRKVRTKLEAGSGVGFNYGVQVGQGGIVLANSSSISGNVYSNGVVTGSGNIIRGDVVSAGATGRVSGIRATSSVYAHTIQNSTIDKDAHYVSISGSTVGGTLYPASVDQEAIAFPITDEMITEWEDAALLGGTHTAPCPYTISSSITLGPRKIPCDVVISGTPTITLGGPVWIEGNLTISNSAIIRVSSSLPGKSVPIIADKATNRTTSSKVIMQNSATFDGSGANSYVLIISQNQSAENGGGETAIEVSNSVSGDLLLFAGHGEVEIGNSVSLREVTAYRISLKNSAVVVYESGLANLLFSSGPSGGWSIDSWGEIE